MSGKKDRVASFVSAYFLIMPDGMSKSITEESRGTILEEANPVSITPGLPFRSLFFVPSLGRMFHEAREIPASERGGYIVGQEEAIQRIAQFIDFKFITEQPSLLNYSPEMGSNQIFCDSKGSISKATHRNL